jgi:hypothetical protein
MKAGIWTEVFIDGERLRGLNWLSGPWSARGARPDAPLVFEADPHVRIRPDMPARPGELAQAEPGAAITAQVLVYLAGKIYFAGEARVEYCSEDPRFLVCGRPDIVVSHYRITPIYTVTAESAQPEHQGAPR